MALNTENLRFPHPSSKIKGCIKILQETNQKLETFQDARFITSQKLQEDGIFQICYTRRKYQIKMMRELTRKSSKFGEKLLKFYAEI